MSTMSQKIIPEALHWLNVVGINLLEEKLHFQGVFMLTIASTVVILEFILLILNVTDVDVVVGIIEVLGPVFLAILKVFVLIIHRKIFLDIQRKINNFWSMNKFTPELESEIENMFVLVKTMLLSFRWLAIAATTLIITLKPILLGVRGFPIEIWQPFNMKASPYYEITYVLESLVGYFASTVNGAFDSLFVGYVTHIIAQLMLLKYAFRNMEMLEKNSIKENESSWEQMKLCIEHHNHLLKIIDDVQDTHSFLFSSVFATGTLCVCIDFYSVALVSGNLDIMQLIKYLVQCSFFVFLLFAYCFTGDQFTNEFLSVADAIYESQWTFGPLPRFRKAVILVVQRSHQQMNLTASGFVTLNLENFVKMLRLAFSVFTLIRTQAPEEP